MTTNTIDGITYFDAPETDGCEGCVAETNSPLCAKLQQTGGSYNYCAAHEVIWILPTKPDKITTRSGVFQQAPVEGRKPCNGCVAQLNARLCNEIGDQHNCVQNPGTIWIKAQPKPVPGIAEAIQLLAKESTLTEVLEYCKVNKLNFRI